LVAAVAERLMTMARYSCLSILNLLACSTMFYQALPMD
jgi:hypothetical protein